MTADGAQAGASAAFRAYLEEIGRNLTAGNATEHTHRPVLQQLVQALDPQVRAVNEPKRVECGAPDYIVTRNDLPVGYIEAKDVGRSLDEIERDEQLKRYRGSLSNLILTDYLEFRWYKDGEKQQTARLAYVGDSGVLRPDREGQKQATAMLSSFLAQEPPIVGKPEDLARRMAALTRIVRDIVRAALEHDRSGGSQLRDQLEGFRRVLIHDLGEEQFADMYAQTIAYGLFAARVNAPAGEHFSRQHAAYDLPKTNPFLRQMFGQIAGPELDERITWAVDDLAELLARARMDLVLADFGKRTRQEDPVVHFYETLLKAYDPKMRVARGVYYTPEPVVSYIVRSVDHILRTEFGLPDGLADNSMIEVPVPGKPKETRKVHKVQILDPACGTGTFLAQVIETIRDTVIAKQGAGMWPGYVHDHLLPRLYGFELLMAPYAIAHLKLGLRLKETGYDIEQSERLRVYLTNSLEEAHEREHGQLTFFGTWLAEEADRASEVKRELPIMVILGNPPYSNSSQNRGEWISGLVADYKAGLGERKVNLDDDYVKFIRFGQWRIDRTRSGVLAFVTNHAFLDNATFREMRRRLMMSFDRISILDLHGDTRRGEASPDRSRDVNVFDIQQGVSINLFVRHEQHSKGAVEVRFSELWGDRSDKYSALLDSSCESTVWQYLQPREPYLLYVPQNDALAEEYLHGTRVTEMFGQYTTAIQTARDSLATAFTADELSAKLRLFADPTATDAAIRSGFGVADGRGWTVPDARRRLRDTGIRPDLLMPYSYRPYDQRVIYYSPIVVAWPRTQIARNVAGRPNLVLLCTRNSNSPSTGIALLSRGLADKRLLAGSRGEAKFMYLYKRPVQLETQVDAQSPGVSPTVPATPNLNPSFLALLAETTGLDVVPDGFGDGQNTVGPEGILSYVFAVLSSPTYRTRYADFLKTDFPHIPLTSNRELFRELCRFGSRLVTLHLMEADDLTPITTYPVPGDNRVEKVRYTEPGQGAELGRVWMNAAQYFEGVPPDVWEFHVGGYQVCAKWLKDRKGRLLTYDDLTHYQYVVAALAETIALMREIDAVIETHGGWPLS